MERSFTRRVILIGCGASLVSVACGDSESGDAGGAGAGSNTGGANGGDGGTGGMSTGGANAGGDNTGGGANACGATLMVQGSNYASDPHDISIPIADLNAGVTRTYTSTGSSHTHDITLTEADFAALKNGETVKKYTCFTDAAFTDHEFVISCADPSVKPTFEGDFGTSSDCPAL